MLCGRRRGGMHRLVHAQRQRQRPVACLWTAPNRSLRSAQDFVLFGVVGARSVSGCRDGTSVDNSRLVSLRLGIRIIRAAFGRGGTRVPEGRELPRRSRAERVLDLARLALARQALPIARRRPRPIVDLVSRAAASLRSRLPALGPEGGRAQVLMKSAGDIPVLTGPGWDRSAWRTGCRLQRACASAEALAPLLALLTMLPGTVGESRPVLGSSCWSRCVRLGGSSRSGASHPRGWGLQVEVLVALWHGPRPPPAQSHCAAEPRWHLVQAALRFT